MVAAAKGHIPHHLVERATLATILEAGAVAFHKAYYGAPEWAKVSSDVKANRQAYEDAGRLQESFLGDVSRISRELREAATSSDLPLILGDIRNRVIRDTLNPVQSHFWEIALPRVATDFKTMRSYRVNPAQELVLRAEGEDVELTTITMAADGYAVANYELGILFTWENWKNDDLGIYTIALRNLGIAAQRTRAKVVLQAIAAGVTAVDLTTLTAIPTYTATVGGPTIDNLVYATQYLAQVTNPLDPMVPARAMGFMPTDIAYAARWLIQANQSLRSATLVGPTAARTPSANPVFGIATPHEERIMAEVLGNDWLLWDSNVPFVERAVLDEFAGGPLTYTQMPDVVEHVNQGLFSNHSVGTKVGDAVGAKVISTLPVLRVKGS